MKTIHDIQNDIVSLRGEFVRPMDAKTKKRNNDTLLMYRGAIQILELEYSEQKLKDLYNQLYDKYELYKERYRDANKDCRSAVDYDFKPETLRRQKRLLEYILEL